MCGAFNSTGAPSRLPCSAAASRSFATASSATSTSLCSTQDCLPYLASRYLQWQTRIGFRVSRSPLKPCLPSFLFLGPLAAPSIIALVGVCLYAAKIPERFSPGTFDLLLNSHNFHHMWSTTYAVLMLQNLIHWSDIHEDDGICA